MKAVRTHLRGEHDQVLPAAGLDSRFDVEAWCQPAQAGIRGGAHRGSTLVARLRRGAGRKGSISLEVNGQPAGTVEIPLMMMMISRFNSSTTTGPPRRRRGRQPR